MRTPRAIGIGKPSKSSDLVTALINCRTIHGMVYNAMKLFMEINPQLFDDCSHEYTEHQNNADARMQAREDKWKALAEQAKHGKANGVATLSDITTPNRTKGSSRIDEVDPMTEDNQKRLDSLKLQDGDRRDRRPSLHDRQNSVGSSRSQR
jgi:serine/threonine-protein phosphatase 2A regulatory subunit B'